jgi:hypothetical protein
MRTTLFAASLLALSCGTALAQGASTPTAPAAPAAVSPAKKELVNRLLTLQRPAIELVGRQLAEAPAMQLMQRAGMVLQRLPAERRDVLAREIEADLRQYADEAVPIVRDKAVALAPSTIGTLLEERLDEADLRQIIAALESPAFRKYQGLTNDMQRVLGQKLLAETRGSIEPKARALEQTISRRLQPPAGAASAAGGTK